MTYETTPTKDARPPTHADLIKDIFSIIDTNPDTTFIIPLDDPQNDFLTWTLVHRPNLHIHLPHNTHADIRATCAKYATIIDRTTYSQHQANIHQPTTPTIQEIYTNIQHMLEHDHYHTKRGFKLSNTTLDHSTNHLLEEAVELQAEIQHGTPHGILQEASDPLTIYLHLLIQCHITLPELLTNVHNNLRTTFTTDTTQTNTNNPGYNRTNRTHTTIQPDAEVLGLAGHYQHNT